MSRVKPRLCRPARASVTDRSNLRGCDPDPAQASARGEQPISTERDTPAPAVVDRCLAGLSEGTPSPMQDRLDGNRAMSGSSTSDNVAPKAPIGRGRSALDWTFRSRKTGKVTLAQFPNLSLGIFLAASHVGSVIHVGDTAKTVLYVVTGLSLAWWALDEIIRGVNPWRRVLG
ncbi:MAG: conserved rane protein of unknown function, partial [Acidimicrobiaceae bacterium]|nr:conserved rane protein of unknown function [Acidimicrobiaceae bacterium]